MHSLAIAATENSSGPRTVVSGQLRFGPPVRIPALISRSYRAGDQNPPGPSSRFLLSSLQRDRPPPAAEKVEQGGAGRLY